MIALAICHLNLNLVRLVTNIYTYRYRDTYKRCEPVLQVNIQKQRDLKQYHHHNWLVIGFIIFSFRPFFCQRKGEI